MSGGSLFALLKRAVSRAADERAQELLPLTQAHDSHDPTAPHERRRTSIKTGEDKWDFVIVFPQDFRGKVDPREIRHFFAPRVCDEWERSDTAFWDKVYKGALTSQELQRAVREQIASILSGSRFGCRLGWALSVDSDEMFLLVRIDDLRIVAELADGMQFSARFSEQAYHLYGLIPPRVSKTFSRLIGWDTRECDRFIAYATHSRASAREFRAKTEGLFARAREEIKKVLRRSVPDHELVAKLAGDQTLRGPLMAVLVDRIDQRARGCPSLQRPSFTARASSCVASTFNAPDSEALRLEKLFEAIDVEYETAALTNRRRIQDFKEEDKLAARLDRWRPRTSPDGKLSGLQTLEQAELFDKFSSVQVLRIIYDWLSQHVNLEQLQSQGVIVKYFCMHDADDVDRLKRDWGSLNPKRMFSVWPGFYNDAVRDYFGEEVGFCFVFMTYYARFLVLPAVLGVGAFFCPEISIRGFGLPHAFCFGMNLWFAYLVSTFEQMQSLKTSLWGMDRFVQQAVRRMQYNEQDRGSNKEAAIRAVHWLAALCAVVEALVMPIFICELQAAMDDDKRGLADPVLHGLSIPRAMAQLMIDYGIAVNLQLVSTLWDFVSPLIAEYENWKTQQEFDDAQVQKTFLVYAVVYYYPFLYVSLIKGFLNKALELPVMETLTDRSDEKQWAEDRHVIQGNLHSYFVLLIVKTVATAIFQVCSAKYARRQEERHLKDGQRYAAHESEAKRPKYQGDNVDYMNCVIGIGLIVFFSPYCPLIAAVAFVVQFLGIRLMAYRMLHVVNRPVPSGQEGIGAWLDVLKSLSQTSSTVCMAIATFALQPLRSQPWSSQLLIFIIGQRTLHFLAAVIDAAVPPKSAELEIFLEHRTQSVRKILMGTKEVIRVEEGTRKIINGCMRDVLLEEPPNPLEASTSDDPNSRRMETLEAP